MGLVSDVLLPFLTDVDAQYPPEVTHILAICDNQQRVCAHHARWRLVFTPTHASWLNQIDLWFGIVH